MAEAKLLKQLLYPRWMEFRCDDEQTSYYFSEKFGLETGDMVLVLGEIANMPDHYAVANVDGIIVPSIHPDNLFDWIDSDD